MIEFVCYGSFLKIISFDMGCGGGIERIDQDSKKSKAQMFNLLEETEVKV